MAALLEEDWLRAEHPAAMLRFLEGKASDRKMRLFACWCARLIQGDAPWLPPSQLFAELIDLAELHAEGQGNGQQLARLFDQAQALLPFADEPWKARAFVLTGHPQAFRAACEASEAAI